MTDDDKGNVTVTLQGVTLRSYVYVGDTARRTKMLAAREYVEGWCDGWDAFGSAAVPDADDIRNELLR